MFTMITLREYNELKDLALFFPAIEYRDLTHYWHLWFQRIEQPLRFTDDDTSMYDEKTADLWKISQHGKLHEDAKAHADRLEEIDEFFGREEAMAEVKIKKVKKVRAKLKYEGVERRTSSRLECKRNARAEDDER